MKDPIIASGFVDDALASLSGSFVSASTILRDAGLSDMHRDSITAQEYGRLWLAIARALDDEFFGLSARPMRHGSFELLCHAVLHAGNLERALRRALKFLRVAIDEPHGRLVVADGQAQIVLSGSASRQDAFAYRTFWVILLGVSCWLIGRRIPLQRIDFACPAPAERTDYLEFFGVPIHFDQTASRLVFDSSYLSLPTVRTEQSLRGFLRNTPGNLLVRYPHDTGWVAKIYDVLRPNPPAEWPDFDTLAEALGVAPTTLRRRLRGEGQSYMSIKDELRTTLAQALLKEGALSVAEVACEVGFTEASAFHRAFRKRTGVSPGAYRQASQQR